MSEQEELFTRGVLHINKWCELNKVSPPFITAFRGGKPKFSVCAYYRKNAIHIWIHRCAKIGRTGQQWSYPGYSVDRTPYGVLAHELGHHVDEAEGKREGLWSKILRRETLEEPISGYSPNDNEWFAEIFRLFVTNPNFLLHLRPRMYTVLASLWPIQVETRDWEQVLIGSIRHLNAAQNKIRAVVKRNQPQMSL